MQLRPDQLRVKAEVYSLIRGGKSRVVVQAMTSFGKTALAAAIAKDALERGLGVIFTAPLITLVDQTAEEFFRWGVDDIGILQADHPMTDLSRPVQICSIQTIRAMMRRDPLGWESYQRGKLVIHDECHILHQAAKQMNALADRPVIGLSATPWRAGMAEHFDALVCGPSTRDLINAGSLSDYSAFSHYVPDMAGVAVGADGDYSMAQTGEKYEPKVIGDIVRTWRRYAEGRKTILFAPRVADAERFAAEFRAAGFAAVAVSGYMDSADCAAEVRKFRDGQTQILCSVSKLATGFSVRDVGCIVDTQPTQSLMRHVQKLGRGLRTHPDKDRLIILDNAGNLLRNGLPDAEYPQSLSGEKERGNDRRKADQPLPKACPSCGTVKAPKVRQCPACGFTPSRQSELEVEAGELVEVGKAANRKSSWDEKVDFVAQLKGYARSKGYQDGWVAHQYREKFGVWPNDPRVKDATPRAPGELVYGWIKHQAIRKARRAA